MRDAAVGFQCVGCVAEGAKSTRTARTAYGGTRSANPALTSISLIVVNVAVWLAMLSTGGRNSWLVDRLALIPRGRCMIDSDPGMFYPQATEAQCSSVSGLTWVDGVASGYWWQLVTSAFAHVEPWHIGFNMFALWLFGPQLEQVLGRSRFLALYFLSAMAGSAAVLWLSDPYGATLGASGAIFGLLGCLLVVAHKVGGNYRAILALLGINVVITVVGSSFISWQGHLGGLVGGLLVAVVIVYSPRTRRGLWQLLGLSAIGLATLVAIVLRAITL